MREVVWKEWRVVEMDDKTLGLSRMENEDVGN